MNTIQDGGPAFPSEEPSFVARDDVLGYSPGMTLRDYFAAKAMPLAWKTFDEGYSPDDLTPGNIARAAYQFADAMLAARNQPEQQS